MSSSITLTLRFMNGDEVNYVARKMYGKACYRTHSGRMMECAYKHLGLSKNDYKITLLHEDDEERIVAIREERERKHSARYEASVLEEISKYIVPYEQDYREVMETSRYYTEDTTVFVFCEKREVSIDELWDRLEDEDGYVEEYDEYD